MEYLAYIIVALIPALSVTFVVITFLKKQNERDVTTLNMDLKKERQKFFLEPRMEAYQRAVLLLERINPQSLIMRLHDTNKSAVLLQTELLSNIRSEFDHNVAQQIFISTSSWEMVKKSKEETIKIINVAAQSLKEDASAIELCNKIFEIVGELDELPTEITIKVLKEELQRLF
ncbi:DUF7935 family protein [Brumimicrobium aurantiacum]|uniref:Uncharacterized protein n=1 Tax=Brumimicrobium aurantiacum TaxID=1737063 RepID=A0A3E1EYW2_9FLAO|nr:hypothetical protein [Brumimicrobium aurantiacum]RFC54673.1 hypothetical protein DXU93_06705 [Brumimicrobium aurantiacum]